MKKVIYNVTLTQNNLKRMKIIMGRSKTKKHKMKKKNKSSTQSATKSKVAKINKRKQLIH